MIRKWLLMFLISIILVALQSTWLRYIAFMSIIPDVSLLFIVYVSFHSKDIKGQSAGFLSGLIEDCISAAPLGLNAFIKTSIAFLANLLSGKFYIDRVIMPAVFALIATLLKAFLSIVLAFFFSPKLNSYNFLSSTLWIECAYNAVIAPVLFILLSPLNRFLFDSGKRQ